MALEVKNMIEINSITAIMNYMDYWYNKLLVLYSSRCAIFVVNN